MGTQVKKKLVITVQVTYCVLGFDTVDIVDIFQIIRCHSPEHTRFRSHSPEKLELAVFSTNYENTFASLHKKNPVFVYVKS
jgi:hypothetical protein